MNWMSPLTLKIGATGHRLNKLSTGEFARLSTEVRKLVAGLQSVVDEISRQAEGFVASSARLQVISPLAEGADRIVATSATELGAELVALLPFAQEDCLLDFSSDRSRAEFLHLLGKAKEIVELDGRRDTEESRNSAYARVGAMVVARSDLLIALWDGEPAEGIGGTAEVIELAKRDGCPVFWLPTSNGRSLAKSSAPRLLLGGDIMISDAAAAFSALAKILRARQP
jgi:hypothetical protein